MIRRERPALGNKRVVVDCKDALLGKVAARVAKHLLEGVSVDLVRCEDILITGKVHRNYLKFQSYLNKHVSTNHRRGPFHHRSPSAIVKKTVRGMLPRKTFRGQEALKRLRCYEGIPEQRVGQKSRCYIPEASKHYVCKTKKFTHLGTLSQRFGWKYSGVVKSLEKKRKVLRVVKETQKNNSNQITKKAKKNVKQDIASIEQKMMKYCLPELAL
ncbi:MAG: 60S ribosomal protein L13A [Paramarteilia canceri]